MSYDFSHYSGSDIPEPKRPVKPRLERNPTAIEARAYADAFEEYERELESYKENLSYYRHQKEERLEKFKIDVAYDYGLKKPQFDLIWEYVGSSDLQQSYNEFDRFYEFGEAYKKLVSTS